eukprot:m.1606296 g.1606296  ORF g.1606296 m.1606296 type:complete len:54 (+) comp25360_c0_seq2:5573-5734(+)
MFFIMNDTLFSVTIYFADKLHNSVPLHSTISEVLRPICPILYRVDLQILSQFY